MSVTCPQCKHVLPFHAVLQHESRLDLTCDRCDARLLLDRRWFRPRGRSLRELAVALVALSGTFAVVYLLERIGLVDPRTVRGSGFRIVALFIYIGVILVIGPRVFTRYTVTVLQRGNHCHARGYDLRGLPDRRCPECGLLNPE